MRGGVRFDVRDWFVGFGLGVGFAVGGVGGVFGVLIARVLRVVLLVVVLWVLFVVREDSDWVDTACSWLDGGAGTVLG